MPHNHVAANGRRPSRLVWSHSGTIARRLVESGCTTEALVTKVEDLNVVDIRHLRATRRALPGPHYSWPGSLGDGPSSCGRNVVRSNVDVPPMLHGSPPGHRFGEDSGFEDVSPRRQFVLQAGRRPWRHDWCQEV